MTAIAAQRPRTWTLWAGTLGFDSTIDERIAAASHTGCVRTSIGPLDLRRMGGGRSATKEVGAKIRDAGLEVVLDPIMNWYPSSDAVPTPFAEFSLEHSLEMAADVGAVSATAMGQLRRHLGTPSRQDLPPLDVDPAVLTEHFAALSDRAADAGLQVELEFIPMTDVRDLATSWAIVRDAARANGSLVLDAWHFFRSGAPFDLLAEIPATKVTGVQLNDGLATVSGTLFEDVRRRMLPGTGSFDLVRLVQVLDTMGALQSVGPEVINAQLAEMAPAAAAELACRYTAELLEAAGLQTHSVGRQSVGATSAVLHAPADGR